MAQSWPWGTQITVNKKFKHHGINYDSVSETQALEKDNTVSILIYLCFSEADLGLLLQEENGLVG